jgi:hypothetical protein
MKTRLQAGLAALAVLALVFASVATAASQHTTNGTLGHFSYSSSKHHGILTVTLKSSKPHFVVPNNANCGVSKGQSGDKIPCKTLGKSTYANKPVTVTWKRDTAGRRIASLVAVHLK